MIVEDKEIKKLLEYYMGKNTMERQEFIIGNLRIEKDEVDEVAQEVLEIEA